MQPKYFWPVAVILLVFLWATNRTDMAIVTALTAVLLSLGFHANADAALPKAAWFLAAGFTFFIGGMFGVAAGGIVFLMTCIAAFLVSIAKSP
jgi:hypothetical protein